MASLKDLLQKTMLFTAARGAGIPDVYHDKRSADAPLVCPKPAHTPTLPPQYQPVWYWEHEAGAPAKVTGIKALMREHGGMMMPVCTRIEVQSASVVVSPGEAPITLPLTPAHVLCKYSIASGRIAGASKGWWQLPAEIDPSLLVVFGYELKPSGDVKTLRLETIEAMGPRFFPSPDVASDDPDAGDAPAPSDTLVSGPVAAKVGEEVVCYVTSTWVILAFGLTTCKERNDFEPGEVLGAGRVYPHVMVSCNRPLTSVDTKVHVERPSKAMKHHPEMKDEIGAILMTDTNSRHEQLPGAPPIPIWSNFFDYYDLAPATASEFTCIDAKRDYHRTLQGAIQREANHRTLTTTSVYEASTSFTKVPRQGDFDNIHLAPKMEFQNPRTRLKIPNITMAPFCIHDCFHTHFRWGLADTPVPRFIKGFDGRKPYAVDAAPLAPSNQTVSVALTSSCAFSYHATAAGPIAAGTWTVFYHHGSAYALTIADETKFKAAQFAVATIAIHQVEPYTEGTGAITPVFDREIVDVDPMSSIAAFYHRLQFTGSASHDWKPRIRIIDLERCRRT